VTVEARNLTVRISTLRKVLADDEGTDYIETVARIGYRISFPSNF
jgi:DNA-binding winged helix-turn-helix (wHTH) protein